MKLTHIKWIDSCSPSDSNWHKVEELHLEPLTCESVGWVLKEDKKSISLAPHMTEGQGLYGVLTIPTVAILKRKNYG